ncbi:CinA family protein [Thalassoglobus sp.]|uniref:CinA family protein n=1 Tax=Thalassoglobus sp. TaxID=2795869 RepID=UPI003AA88A1C
MSEQLSLEDELQETAEMFVSALRKRSVKIVFAESCTSGLLAATLSKIPGVSNSLCGSFVTYRNDSKSSWLGVSDEDLAAPEVGPVSETVARQMAQGALHKTPEADLAVSVTGHLGPDAPPQWDGIAFSGIAARSADSTSVTKFELRSEPEAGLSLRQTRQFDAALQVMRNALTHSSLCSGQAADC